MAKTWSGRPREIELRPVVQKGLPAAVIVYILFTLVSLSVTIGTAVYCIANPVQEGYDVPGIGSTGRPLETPNGH